MGRFHIAAPTEWSKLPQAFRVQGSKNWVLVTFEGVPIQTYRCFMCAIIRDNICAIKVLCILRNEMLPLENQLVTLKLCVIPV